MQRQYFLRHTFSVMVLLVWLVSNAASQERETGLGGDAVGDGQNAISGTIRQPSGQKLQRQIMVQLSTSRGNFTVSSDSNGNFVFSGLRNGTYRISLDAGKEYEPVNETVDIAQASRNRGIVQTIPVEIQLRLKRNENPPPGVVDVSSAGIPKPALELYGEALKSKQKSDFHQAIEQLKSAILLDAKFMLAFNELGLLYMQTGQLDEAETALQSALKLAPAAFPPIFNHGLLLVRKKQFDEAEKELRRAMAKDEKFAGAHLYLGRVLVSLQNYDEAEQQLLRALALGGDGLSLGHRFLGALYMERGDNEKAVKELKKYLQLEPKAKDAEQLRTTIKRLRNN